MLQVGECGLLLMDVIYKSSSVTEWTVQFLSRFLLIIDR